MGCNHAGLPVRVTNCRPSCLCPGLCRWPAERWGAYYARCGRHDRKAAAVAEAGAEARSESAEAIEPRQAGREWLERRSAARLPVVSRDGVVVGRVVVAVADTSSRQHAEVVADLQVLFAASVRGLIMVFLFRSCLFVVFMTFCAAMCLFCARHDDLCALLICKFNAVAQENELKAKTAEGLSGERNCWWNTPLPARLPKVLGKLDDGGPPLGWRMVDCYAPEPFAASSTAGKRRGSPLEEG